MIKFRNPFRETPEVFAVRICAKQDTEVTERRAKLAEKVLKVQEKLSMLYSNYVIVKAQLAERYYSDHDVHMLHTYSKPLAEDLEEVWRDKARREVMKTVYTSRQLAYGHEILDLARNHIRELVVEICDVRND